MTLGGSVMQRGGWGPPLLLKRPASLHHGIVEFGVAGRRHVADGAVRPDSVVIIRPAGLDVAGMVQ